MANKKPLTAYEMPTPTKPKRCLECLYVIDNLSPDASPQGVCPECGTPFDTSDPNTYTNAEPYVAWKFYIAPLLGITAIALACVACFTAMGSYGTGLLLALPAAMGFSIGYGTRIGFVGLVLLGIGILTALGLAIVYGGLGGVFCTAMLVGIFLIPLGFCALLGLMLRGALSSSGYSQSAYNRYGWCIALFAGSVLFGYFERGTPNQNEISVSTGVLIAAPPEVVWDSLVFYEDATGERTLLLKLGLPKPVRTEGVLTQPGDTAICIYDKGRAHKVATTVEEDRELAFIVTDHNIGFERSVQLLEGSYVLTPINNGVATHLEMTTTYRPKLQGRWAWQPIEKAAIHDLHNFVGASIEYSATSLSERATADAY